MRFLLDMPVSPDLVGYLALRGHSAMHASAAGLAMTPDTEIMAQARTEGRIVVTADLHFPRILALTQADGPAEVLFRGGNYSDAEMQSLLGRVLDSVSEEHLETSVTVVDRARIRRTRLPIRRTGGDAAPNAG